MPVEERKSDDVEKGAREPLTTKGSGVDDSSPSKVTFTPASPDGKTNETVDIVSPGRSGYGLSKSELMIYANDPVWRKIRMGVFILFWLVWLGLLGASVFIVSTSTCSSRRAKGN